MGVSRRSIVFGRGKRPLSEDDCAENTLRVLSVGQNPSISTFREKSSESPKVSPSRTLLVVSESGGEEDSRENNIEITEGPSDNNLAADVKKSVVKRKTGTFWNTDEAMIFYDGIKEHGKNFEQIVSILNRKKLTKDKDQVRNFFYNTYKIFKEKAAIAENEWAHVPQTAKELLVVINVLEWRKRCHSTNVNAMKFKTLIMIGTTNVKIPGKRIPISIRTPNCSALHKFFPSLKQSAKVPNTMQIQLVPNSYASKRYVLSCEQNPLLTIALNTQSAISTLFRFLEQKWQKFPVQERKTNQDTQQPPTVIFYPPESFKPSKVLIQSADDAHPSVKTLKSGGSKAISSNMPSTSSVESQEPSKNLSNFFEIFEEQLINGLTIESASNASFLHLYLLFNQQSTIRLRYDVITNVRSSNVFIKLSELIRNSEGIIDNIKTKKKSSTPQFIVPQTSAVNSNVPKRQPNFQMANKESGTTNIVDNERARFMQQLVALRQKSKDAQKIGKSVGKSPNKRMCISAVTSPRPESQQAILSLHDSSLEESLDSFGFIHYRKKNTTTVHDGKTFANLQSIETNITVQEQPTTSTTNNCVFEDVANSELTRNSLLPSPSKSLQEDAYRYFESMASQNSNDIFSNFSQLINSVASESSQSAME